MIALVRNYVKQNACDMRVSQTDSGTLQKQKKREFAGDVYTMGGNSNFHSIFLVLVKCFGPIYIF